MESLFQCCQSECGWTLKFHKKFIKQPVVVAKKQPAFTM